MTEEPSLEIYEHIDPEFMPDLVDRMQMILQLITEDGSALETEMQAAWTWIDAAAEEQAAEDPAFGDRLFALHGRVLEPYVEPAKLASFDFIPAENEDVGMLIHRLRVRAAFEYWIHREHRWPNEDPYGTELKAYIAKGHEFLGWAAADFDDGLERMDAWLTEEEDRIIAAYYPEFLEALAKESGYS